MLLKGRRQLNPGRWSLTSWHYTSLEVHFMWLLLAVINAEQGGRYLRYRSLQADRGVSRISFKVGSAEGARGESEHLIRNKCRVEKVTGCDFSGSREALCTWKVIVLKGLRLFLLNSCFAKRWKKLFRFFTRLKIVIPFN